MTVGFIGLGAMGGAIARRLARRDFAVLGCDVLPSTLAAFDEPGSGRERDPLETARRSDVLCVCVRTDAQLEELVADGALFAALGAGGVFILNSTVAPELARRQAALAAQHGVDYIDVGVSGGAPAAIEGKLALFVGGEAAAVARVRDVLDAMGTVFHLGPVGRGLEGKLLNNLASIANFGLAAAILDLCTALDFDRETLRQALLAGSARSFALEVVPTMLGWTGAHAEPGYADRIRELLAKDVHHAQDLFAHDNAALQTLVASSGFMLEQLAQAD